MDHIENTRGQPQLTRQPCKAPRGDRRILGRFEDRSVSADERRKHLPSNIGQWCIRGDDQPSDAERLAYRDCCLVRNCTRGCPTVEAPSFTSDKEPHFDCCADFTASVLATFAGFRSDEFRKTLALLMKPGCNGAQQVTTRDRCQRPPSLIGLARGSNGCEHVRSA